MSEPGITAEHSGLHPEDHWTGDDHARFHNAAGAVVTSDEQQEEPDQTLPDMSMPNHEEKKGIHSMHELGHALKESVKHGAHKMHDLLQVNSHFKHDDKDYHLYPELEWDAELRRNNALHLEELQFLDTRRKRIAESGVLAKFIGLPPDEVVNPEDVPIIGIGGSGGGYRACFGLLTVFAACKEVEMWDLISYVAGVSGSCWSLGAYYTFANRDAQNALDHFMANAHRHPISASAVNTVMNSPNGADFLFGPLLYKLKTGVAPVILDLYSTVVHSYMFLPLHRQEPGEMHAQLKKEWFQWSKVWERSGIKAGEEPFPILTAVRHERPWRDWKSKTEPFGDNNHTSKEHQEAEDAWWQWFEITPLELGCDELEGWVPTWAFGRKFDKGLTGMRLPEQSLAMLLGLSTSAPAGPLSSYLGTIYRNLPKGPFGGMMRGFTKEIEHIAPQFVERFGDHHPIHACNEANPFFGAEQEPNRGQGFENSPRLHLIDAGMGNNMPTYSFIHPNRDVDVILNFDYSSDVQKDAALERVNDMGKDKGLKFQPRTKLAELPPLPILDDKGKPKPWTAETLEKTFEGRYAQVIDGVRMYNHTGDGLPEGFHFHTQERPGGPILYNKRHQPQARRDMTMVYLPLLPNKVQPEYDPSNAPWSSSYNLVWTPEQIQTLEKTQKQNFNDSLDTIRAVIKEAYNKRKADRLSGIKPFTPATHPVRGANISPEEAVSQPSQSSS
ncbi:FabD/lysophospholipase-like protein [Calocera viscosa TUFC12733]|uniref:Lysophospholipase n=1 Tax=Calocera viscosa (strain TUFC12733) TaxID=1330018 RepID=A0A167M5T1_CALVF|nr:FabD/lysophospholipase-like protein [Calocera viscosa TUFC12733]